MTDEGRKLAEFIQDKSKGSREFIFNLSDVKEISEIGRKIDRLLEELERESIIHNAERNGLNRVCVTIVRETSQKQNTQENGSYDLIHARVMQQFIKPGYRNFAGESGVIRSYSELFKLFVQIKNDEAEELQAEDLFQFVLDKIDQTKSENYIKILGPDGTGKSTFLSILYVYLYQCFQEKKLAQYPFYINLHYYDSAVTQADTIEELDKKVEQKMKEDLQELLEISKDNEKAGFLIIIDGRDKYYRSQLHSGNTLDKILGQIKGHKKIICLGEKTNVHSSRELDDGDDQDFRTAYTFHFSPINIHKEEKWLCAVERHCTIVHKEKEIKPIVDCIKRFKIKEVDYNLFTILESCSKRHKFSEVKSISSLYRTYCMNYLENSEERLKIAIDFAYQYFMTGNMIKQHDISENWREWELIHQHKTISNYLLARHYADLIQECRPENVEQLECVFTNGINIFLKSISNEKKEYQNKTLFFCKEMFGRGGYKAQAQAAYLLGRIEDEILKERAKEILAEQLTAVKEKREKESGLDKRDDKRFLQKEREYHFLCRSILVSMLYLGDCRAGAELLNMFFQSSVMNEVNRAFYLQYYDDVRLEPEEVNLIDSGNGSILYTSGVLLNYIHNLLRKPETSWTWKEKYEFQIYLFTLCSLIQVRLNESIEADIVKKLCEVISLTLKQVKNNLNKEMYIYLQMIQEDIEKKAFKISHLYNELYGLKKIQRRGWAEKIKQGSIPRNGDFLYENVAEHTYYTWLLGMLYLPENFSLDVGWNDNKGCDYSKYDKRKILDCILIHDLAESYLGDKLPEETTLQHKEKENECMRRIFMHDMYAGIGRMDGYRAIWKSFSLTSDDINGKIAKELDIIQAIYQFGVYKRMGAEFAGEKEKEWKEEKTKIETSIGVEILNEVVLKNFKDIFPDNDKEC